MDNHELMTNGQIEERLSKEVTSIEAQANEIVIRNDDDYAFAGQVTRNVKAAQKKVEDYWEPMRKSTYEAYKAVTDHKKEMLDPLKNAETILKRKIGVYQMEQERKRREEEERLRKLAEEEANRKLEEAVKAEANGDLESAEYAMAEAEALDSMSVNVQMEKPKVSGVSTTKTWEIVDINPKDVPISIAGVEIRPVDRAAILRLIKATKGQIAIPGVKYKETVSVAVRAS